MQNRTMNTSEPNKNQIQDFEKPLYVYMLIMLSALIIAGLMYKGPLEAIRGFILLQTVSTRLVTDFTLVAGIGGTFINSALVGLIGLGIVRLVKVRLSGPPIAAIFTMMGFSLFGCTPLNMFPLLLGVFIASKIAGTSFSHYLLIAFFGTALDPVSDYLAFELGLPFPYGILLGIGAGILIGIILPAVAMVMLRLHQGFSLYNIGFTAGFIALFASSILIAAGGNLTLPMIWNENPDPFLLLLVPFLSGFSIIFALVLKPKEILKGFIKILKQSGRLPSDFIDMTSISAAFFNMGVLGLLGSAYVFLIGGDFNGPTIGGLMTIMGFGLFGKHLRNCLPIMIGIFLATILFGKNPSDPGPLLAILFGTTLAPLAGEFGPLVGIVAGFLHLVMVDRTASWHGGLNLYNNGFAAGLTATLIVALIEWYRTNRSK